MFKAIQNCFKIPELRDRLLFTLAIIAVYRLGAHIPSPGLDGSALAEMVEGQKAGLMRFYDMFAGGAFKRATVFALGIMPYISVSIIMQLLTAVVPALEKLSKEGAEGRKKITQYTRYGTVLLGLFQSTMFAKVLAGTPGIVPNPNFLYYLTTVVTFTTGVMVIMWLGEQITERGIGNGMSLIICMSIVSSMPTALVIAMEQIRTGELSIFKLLLVLLMMIAVVVGIIAITTGQRRIPIQQARQVKGRKVYGGQRSFLPLRVNHAGVIPIIFASAIMMFPGMLGGFLQRFGIEWLDLLMGQFQYGKSLHMILFVVLIMFFCYFYTAITFNPMDVAENLKRYGSFIPGIRPGKPTADYIEGVLIRITLAGGAILSLLAVMPMIVSGTLDVDSTITRFLGGTSMIIVVGVALDTVKQIETHLLMRHYDGFLSKGKIHGRRM